MCGASGAVRGMTDSREGSTIDILQTRTQKALARNSVLHVICHSSANHHCFLFLFDASRTDRNDIRRCIPQPQHNDNDRKRSMYLRPLGIELGKWIHSCVEVHDEALANSMLEWTELKVQQWRSHPKNGVIVMLQRWPHNAVEKELSKECLFSGHYVAGQMLVAETTRTIMNSCRGSHGASKPWERCQELGSSSLCSSRIRFCA